MLYSFFLLKNGFSWNFLFPLCHKVSFIVRDFFVWKNDDFWKCWVSSLSWICWESKKFFFERGSVGAKGWSWDAFDEFSFLKLRNCFEILVESWNIKDFCGFFSLKLLGELFESHKNISKMFEHYHNLKSVRGTQKWWLFVTKFRWIRHLTATFWRNGK